MIIKEKASLLSYNTFGIDAIADYIIQYESVEDLRAVLNLELLKQHTVLHVGGGSNLLFLGDFKGVILHSSICYERVLDQSDSSVFVEVGAGVVWDDFVKYCVEQGWGGVENLSLIPGEVGASAVQNIGAYGVEVCELIREVKTLEVATGLERVFTNEECQYGYRSSIFKGLLKGQYIVTSVVFELHTEPQFRLTYQHLESEVKSRGEVTLSNVRETIISVRESKLPDPKIYGNAGSFFMNPVVPRSIFEALLSQYPSIPHYYVSETEEKIPAGWLIDQCGWKGRQLGRAGVHDKQALVLVNKGNATGLEIVNLAEAVQESVKEKFGILLHPEVNYIS